MLCVVATAACLSACEPVPVKPPPPPPRVVRPATAVPGVQKKVAAAPVRPAVPVQRAAGVATVSTVQNMAQAGAPSPKAANDWAVQLLLAINRKWAVPRDGSRDLAATVQVAINTAGAVRFAGISSSSGNQSYDTSILQAVYRASPLPLPRDARVFRGSFSICVGANVHGCK